jgi:hypothetical protein
MQKGLGIAALVIAILAIFIPFAGTWLTVVAGGMAAFALGPGFGLGVASVIINIIHILFFSPLLWVTSAVGTIGAVAAGSESAGGQFAMVPWVLIAIQAGAGYWLYASNKKYTADIAAKVQ